MRPHHRAAATASRAVFVLAAMLVGCAPKATFQLAVTNETDRPVTVGVVKEGPPYEAELGAPEEWAIATPLAELPPWGHVVPPGRTIDSPPVTGTFPTGSLAYLRVYGGERTNAELLATSTGSPDRADVLLFPGRNEITVRTGDDGRLRAERAGAARR